MIVLYALFISIALGVILMPFFIPLLRQLKFGQAIREEGPKSHQAKSGTPTMGGIVIIASTVIGLFLSMKVSNTVLDLEFNRFQIMMLIFPLIGFGFIGFLDDYLIVLKKNNKGLSPSLKLLLQIIISSIYFFIYLRMGLDTEISFFNLFSINFFWGYGLILLLLLVYSSNAVNLTDGLDGLASGLLIIAFISFGVIAKIKNEGSIYLFCIVISGVLLSFLVFNFHPAKIMMGDTGSLALGATLGSVAILLKMEVLLFIVGIVFLLETLSVIVQVWYYKKTRGKRIFKMTPIHHHFELSGFSEIKIVYLFYAVGALFGLLGILLGGIM